MAPLGGSSNAGNELRRVGSFVTGITQPIELSFVLNAPLLYGMHAVPSGVAMVAAFLLEIRHGFGFSAGLIDLVINYPLSNRGWWLIPIGLIFAAVARRAGGPPWSGSRSTRRASRLLSDNDHPLVGAHARWDMPSTSPGLRRAGARSEENESSSGFRRSASRGSLARSRIAGARAQGKHR